MPTPSFQGLRVLALESRRATEVADLIATYGGRPLMAPALREIPLESNPRARDFASALIRGDFDIVILLTGVGTRALLNVVDAAGLSAEFAAALGRTKVVVRGPKPLAVMRQLQLPVWVAAPEPNTWRELLAALDEKTKDQRLDGARIAVQEYGVSNPELIDALRNRGAQVTPVPVYRWALPEDVEPLKQAVAALAREEVDVAVFTTSVQVVHLWQIARTMGLEADLRRGFGRTVIASIGPTTSEELERHGMSADLESSHPKMGILIREAAERSADVLRTKRVR